MIPLRASRRGFLEEVLFELKPGHTALHRCKYKGPKAEADRLPGHLL